MGKAALYKILLILLVITMPAGAFLLPINLGIITIYLFRLLLLVSFFILLINKDLKLYIGRITKYLFFLFVFWLAYGLISISWSIDTVYSVKDISYLLSAIILFIVLQSLIFVLEDWLEIVRRYWVMGAILILLLALIEMFSGMHLKGNFIDKLSTLLPGHKANFIPVATFNNPNNFASYIIMSIPFFWLGIKSNFRSVSLLLIVAGGILVHITRSNFGMIALGAQIFLLFLLESYSSDFARILKKTGGYLLIAAIFLGAIFVINPLTEAVYSGDVEVKENVIEDTVTSSNVRKNLILNGIQFSKESYGIGIGAGNFVPYMKDKRGEKFTANVYSPHNWVLEIISQYGILVFIAYCLFLLIVLRELIKMYRSERYRNTAILGLLLIGGYLIISNAPSAFITFSPGWFVLIMVSAMIDMNFINKSKANA